MLFGLGAAAFYAAVILLNKFIRSVAGIQRTFLQFLAAIVILIPYVAATGGVSLGTLDARGWVCLLIVGFFHTGVTYCLYFSALRELPGQEVALLSYMDPLVADPRLHTLERAAGEKIKKGDGLQNRFPFFIQRSGW